MQVQEKVTYVEDTQKIQALESRIQTIILDNQNLQKVIQVKTEEFDKL